MSDIRLDDAGIAWQHCPACGQDVVPSFRGWSRHQSYCPATPTDTLDALIAMLEVYGMSADAAADALAGLDR